MVCTRVGCFKSRNHLPLMQKLPKWINEILNEVLYQSNNVSTQTSKGEKG